MKTGTHTIRVTITVRQTSAASPVILGEEKPDRPSMMPRSCSPTSTNRSALTTNTRISQKASPESRVRSVVSSGVCQPM